MLSSHVPLNCVCEERDSREGEDMRDELMRTDSQSTETKKTMDEMESNESDALQREYYKGKNSYRSEYDAYWIRWQRVSSIFHIRRIFCLLFLFLVASGANVL